MVKSNKKRQKILVVLLAALAVSVVYRITHPFKQKRVETLTFVAGKNIKNMTGDKDIGYQGKPTNIMLTLMENYPHHSGRVVKNIFSDKPTVHKGGDKRDSGIKPSGKKPDVMPNNIKDSGIISPEQTGSGFSSFKVFGMYETEQDKVIFLERGKDILALREGDIIDGKLKVQKITSKMVTIKSEDSDKPFFIDMNGLENN
jgi:hypothetical protein